MESETMFGTYMWFLDRYKNFENDFLGICKYIPLTPETATTEIKMTSGEEEKNLRAGDKLMLFSINVCSEIETVFGKILSFPSFDDIQNIEETRENQSITKYREIFEPKYLLSQKVLKFRWFDKEIYPFEEFKNGDTPKWFSIYSRQKHHKIVFSEELNFLHCVQSLGALVILLSCYPFREEGKAVGALSSLNSKVFDKILSYYILNDYYQL